MAGDADHHGHRGRLRARLIEGGAEALLEHELLEYLLALAIPRRDTKPLAKTLLRRFGGYASVLGASPAELRLAGLSEGAAAALKIAEASALRMLKAGVINRPVLASWSALIDYLTADMAHRPIERVRLLLLNGKNMLIRDDVLAEGSVDQAPVYTREVIKRAIDHHASAMILVHNHPSGDPRPSREDIQMTRAIAEAGKLLGVALHDHVIIGAAGHASFRTLGLL
jgi:DNA repair protein RadC